MKECFVIPYVEFSDMEYLELPSYRRLMTELAQQEREAQQISNNYFRRVQTDPKYAKLVGNVDFTVDEALSVRASNTHCAICSKSFENVTKCLDHDHITGKLRMCL